MMDWISILFGVLAGLALFLLGIDELAKGLHRIAGKRLRSLLGLATKNRVIGTVSGAVTTAVIQSSSITTVLLVGFISAGLLNLQQSVGVIMGANIGSTITAQIIAFKVTSAALPLIIIGYALRHVKYESVTKWSGMILGLGFVFFGMSLMSEATSPLRDYPPFIELMGSVGDKPWLGILFAALFTAIVQSSSATTGVVIVLATQGLITLPAGIALIMGANVGTCFTAALAALGQPREAMRAAIVHTLFNLAGVVIWYPALDLLAWLVTQIPLLSGDNTARSIANAHTLFNIINTIIFLPIAGIFAVAAQRLIPPKQKDGRMHIGNHLDALYLTDQETALTAARREICHQAALVSSMSRNGKALLLDPSLEIQSEQLKLEVWVDQEHRAIIDYLRSLARQPIEDDISRQLFGLIALSDAIEQIGDAFSDHLISLFERQSDLATGISPTTQTHLAELWEATHLALEDMIKGIQQTEYAVEALSRKPQIQSAQKTCERHLAQRLASDDPDRLELYRIERDFCELLRIAHNTIRRAAKEILGIEQINLTVQRSEAIS